MHLRSRFLPAAIATAAAATLTVASGVTATSAHEGDDAHENPQTVPPRLAAEIRSATAAFHNPAKASAAGFVRAAHCVPGMGEHWINQDNLEDGLHDPRNPDVLLYEHGPNGKPRLVGVEWLEWDEDQDLETHNSDRPSLEGIMFDGPMAGHEPGMPVHYDLHLFVWKQNPHGMAHNYNPRVNCPE